MTDQQLIDIYDAAYKTEIEKVTKDFDEINTKARDKDYITELVFAPIAFVHAFRNTKLDQEIIWTFDHYYKIGNTRDEIIVNTIRAIPEIIERHKLNKQHTSEEKKREVTVNYKKLFGIIPYAIDRINIKSESKSELPSTFESLANEKEIAAQLGELKAIHDLFEEWKHKYMKVKSLSKDKDDTFKKLFPEEFKSLPELKQALKCNDLVVFFRALESFFAKKSYNMKVTEAYFHDNIDTILRMLDFNIESESETNIGRIDSVVETENYIHIFEFKLHNCSIAIEQIKEKKYYQKYLTSDKKIILVGVSFDTKEKNILDWRMQTYP